MLDIRLYSTSYCSYCRAAKALLEQRKLPFTEIDCSDDAVLRDRLVAETGRKTVPQIYLGGVPVGGFDDLRALDRSGELSRIVKGDAKPTSIMVK